MESILNEHHAMKA